MRQELQSREFLFQQDWIDRIIQRIGVDQWFPAYLDVPDRR